MKMNKTTLLVACCTATVIGVITVISYFVPSESENRQAGGSNPALANKANDNAVVSKQSSINNPNASAVVANSNNGSNKGLDTNNTLSNPDTVGNAPPHVLAVINDRNMPIAEKRAKMLAFLTNGKDNAIDSAVLRYLAMNATAETVSVILPYLNSRNKEIQMDAIDSLANHSIELSDQLGNPSITAEKLAANKAAIEKIKSALNGMYQSPSTNQVVRDKILSRYGDLPISKQEVNSMVDLVLAKPLSADGVAFIGASLVNTEVDYAKVFAYVGRLDATQRNQIADDLRAQMSIIENDNSVPLSKEQKDSINQFLAKNGTNES